NDQIQVGAFRPKRIVTWFSKLRTGLPPSMLATHDARIKAVIEARASTHFALGGLNPHPIAIGDVACHRRLGVQLHFRMPRALAQTGQTTMLALAKKRVLDAGQDEWKPTHKIRPRPRTDHGFPVFRQRRMTVLQERLGIKFDLARRRGESSWDPIRAG